MQGKLEKACSYRNGFSLLGYTTPPLYYYIVSLLISKEAQAKFNMDSCHSILTGPIRRGAVFLLLCSNNNIQSQACKTQVFPHFGDNRKVRKSVTGLVMSTLPPCDFDTLWLQSQTESRKYRYKRCLLTFPASF